MNATTANSDSKYTLQQTNEKFSLSVYPNPSDYSFTFEIGSYNEEVGIEISDITGKIIFRQNGINKIRWEAGKENSGIYFYKVNMQHNTYSGKLIKL